MVNDELSKKPTGGEIDAHLEALTCDRCMNEALLPFDFSYAFQPIVDIENKNVHSYEALVRGVNGEGAKSILSRIDRNNRFRFDQLCRIKVKLIPNIMAKMA